MRRTLTTAAAGLALTRRPAILTGRPAPVLVTCRALQSRGLHRGPFKRLTGEDVATFRELLREGAEDREGEEMTVLTGEDDTEAYNRDWMGKYRGRSSAVLRPGNREQVAALLRYCHEQHIAVVPQVSCLGGGRQAMEVGRLEEGKEGRGEQDTRKRTGGGKRGTRMSSAVPSLLLLVSFTCGSIKNI